MVEQSEVGNGIYFIGNGCLFSVEWNGGTEQWNDHSHQVRSVTTYTHYARDHGMPPRESTVGSLAWQTSSKEDELKQIQQED